MKKFLVILGILSLTFLAIPINYVSAQSTYPEPTNSWFYDEMPQDSYQYFFEFANKGTSGNRVLITSEQKVKVEVTTNTLYTTLLNSSNNRARLVTIITEQTPLAYKFNIYVKCSSGASAVKLEFTGSAGLNKSWTNPCTSSAGSNSLLTDFLSTNRHNSTGAMLTPYLSNYNIEDYQYCNIDTPPCIINTYFLQNWDGTNGYIPPAGETDGNNGYKYPNPVYSIRYGDYPNFRVHFKNYLGNFLLDCTVSVKYDFVNKRLTCDSNKFHFYKYTTYDDDTKAWAEVFHYDTNGNLELDDSETTLASCIDIVYKNHDIYDIDGSTLRCSVNLDGTPLNENIPQPGDYDCSGFNAIICGIRDLFVPSENFIPLMFESINSSWSDKVQISGESFEFITNLGDYSDTAPEDITQTMDVAGESMELKFLDFSAFDGQMAFIRTVTSSLIYTMIAVYTYKNVISLMKHE